MTSPAPGSESYDLGSRGASRPGPEDCDEKRHFMLPTVGQPTGQSAQAMARRGRAREEWVVTVNYVGNSFLPLAAAYRVLTHDDVAASGESEDLGKREAA